MEYTHLLVGGKCHLPKSDVPEGFDCLPHQWPLSLLPLSAAIAPDSQQWALAAFFLSLSLSFSRVFNNSKIFLSSLTTLFRQPHSLGTCRLPRFLLRGVVHCRSSFTMPLGTQAKRISRKSLWQVVTLKTLKHIYILSKSQIFLNHLSLYTWNHTVDTVVSWQHACLKAKCQKPQRPKQQLQLKPPIDINYQAL